MKIQYSKEVVAIEFDDLFKQTGNVYEALVIISRRAKQIVSQSKRDLEQKLSEFVSDYDDITGVASENEERKTICSVYEKQAKPCIISTNEFIAGELFYLHSQG